MLRFFSEIVRKLPDNDVVIEVGADNQTLITCEKQSLRLQLNQVKIFLIYPAIEKRIPSQFLNLLKEVIRQTIFSIADNDTNKMMSGELLKSMIIY